MGQPVNLNDSLPAAPANTQNVKWQADPLNVDPTVVRKISANVPLLVASGANHQGGLCPDPGSVAGTTKFLREDGSWQVPSGGGSGGPVGTNVAPFPYLNSSNANWQNYSLYCKIPASSITAKANSVKVELQFTAGTTAKIGACKIMRLNPYTSAVVDSTSVLWGGVANPTITIAGGVGANTPYISTSDACTITIDGTMDIFIVVFFINDAANASIGLAAQSLNNYGVFGNFVTGDKTGITDISTGFNTNTMSGSNTLYGFRRLIVAS